MYVGDIVAIRNNETRLWEVAIARWANVNELNQLDVGFELLSPSAQAITVASDKNTAPCKALLLPELDTLKQLPSTTLSHNEFTLGELLRIK